MPYIEEMQHKILVSAEKFSFVELNDNDINLKYSIIYNCRETTDLLVKRRLGSALPEGFLDYRKLRDTNQGIQCNRHYAAPNVTYPPAD